MRDLGAHGIVILVILTSLEVSHDPCKKAQTPLYKNQIITCDDLTANYTCYVKVTCNCTAMITVIRTIGSSL